MQVIVRVQFQGIFEENSSSHQEMMQPVRNVENYPTCKVTATNIYMILLIGIITESLIQKKSKDRKLADILVLVVQCWKMTILHVAFQLF